MASQQRRPLPTRCACPTLRIAGRDCCCSLGIAVAFMHLPHITQTQEFRPAKEGDPSAEPQHLELPAHGAGSAGNLSLRRRRSGIWLDRGELFQACREWTARRPQRSYWFRFVLGRRAGRPPAWLVDADQGQVRASCWAFSALIACALRGSSPCLTSGQVAIVDAGAVRLLQLDHVPEHLCAWHCGPGADDEQGIGADHDGRCGRRE